MQVTLRVVQGTLKRHSGSNRSSEVQIRRPRFLIGAAEDCHMRCPSRSISAHHCELLVDERGVRIHDLHSETGTFVNDRQIQSEQTLSDGDRFRVGKLEFAVQFEKPTRAQADPVADYVSTLLVEADEQDRMRRLEDPETRHFQIDPDELMPAQEVAEKPKQLKRPPKRPPRKLPPPPKYVADNTIQAAEETLKKIFDPKK